MGFLPANFQFPTVMSYVNRAILFTPIGQSDRIPSILDLGSGTGQTDRQTDDGYQCIMPHHMGWGIIKS